MLKVILSALLFIGFCACGGKANEYTTLLNDKYKPLEINEIKSSKTPQDVIIKYYSPHKIGIIFDMNIADEKVYFCTPKGTYFLTWFTYDPEQGRLRLNFASETTPARTIDVQSEVYPTVKRDPPENAFPLQLISEDKLDCLLINLSSMKTIQTKLSLAWIKDFLEEGRPLAKDKKPDCDEGTYVGRPLTIQAEVINKLNRLAQKMSDSSAGKAFVDTEHS